jgi:hypothetical protein
MANPTYNVWVVNQVTLGTRVYDPNNGSYYFDWDQSKLNDTVAELKSLFDEVCKHAMSKFADSTVTVKDLALIASSIKPGEVLVRLTTRKDSIVAKKFPSALSGETEGATIDTGSGVISEAWIEGAAGSATVPKLLARLAFHELMHNKIDALNSSLDIHGKDDGTGLAATPVAYNTAVSATNKLKLAPKLGSVVNQFTGSSIP